MKRNVLLLSLFFLLCFSQQSFSQFSLGIGGTGVRHFGKETPNYPFARPSQYPTLFGGKIRGMYGFVYRNSIQASFAYFIPTPDLSISYGPTSMRMQVMELEFNYHRYFTGLYNEDDFKFYGIVGFSATLLRQDFNVRRPDLINPAELKYFDNQLFEVGHWNLGLGMEVPISSAFFFMEAKAAIHANAFVNKTTIWETNLINFGSATAGLRFPFGGVRKKRRPSR